MARIVGPGEGMRVTIVSHTFEPVRSIALAQLNMRGDMRHHIADVTKAEAEEIFVDICKTELQGAFEFASFNIQFDGVSRAFQQQLTRTRLAAYSAESLRFTDIGMTVLAGPKVTGSARDLYENTAEAVEYAYRGLIQMGVPIEDARGILPLNVLSKIGMATSLKTLVHMSRVRMCYQSQPGEWDYVFRAIMTELMQIDPLLIKPFGAFCDVGQECPFGSILDRDCPRKGG